MQTLLDAASAISAEIARTRQRLMDLEGALSGLKPLIIIDTTTKAVGYIATVEPQPIQDVSDVHIPVADEPVAPAKRRAKPKADAVKAPVAKPARAKKSAKVVLPATGAEFWLQCLGRKKLSIDALTEAAMAALELDAAHRKLIRMRAYSWLKLGIRQEKISMETNASGVEQYKVAARAPA